MNVCDGITRNTVALSEADCAKELHDNNVPKCLVKTESKTPLPPDPLPSIGVDLS